MAQKVYQLKFDDEFDEDINTWLESLPRNKKAEHVRHAIRFYMAYAGDTKYPVMPGVIRSDANVVGAHEIVMPYKESAPAEKEKSMEPPRKRPTIGTEGI